VRALDSFGTEPAPSVSRQATSLRKHATAGKITAALIALSVLAGIYIWKTSPAPQSHEKLRQRQLTINSPDNPVSANSISPDGKYLAYADVKGLHVKVISTGDTRDIPNPEPYEHEFVNWGIPQNWFPEGTRFVANTNPPFQRLAVWVVSVLGTAPRKLRDDVSPWAVSSEGKIACTARPGRKGDRELSIMDALRT
jgi:hypothetical protein